MASEHSSDMDNARAERAGHSPPADETHGGEKDAPILVIEEHPAVCEMLCLALTLAGYRATTDMEGVGWIDRAMHSADPPALVLVDMSNSGREATVFLKELRARWQEAPPLLLMTTSKRIYDEVAIAERVVLKPFHIYDLLVVIQAIIPHKAQKEGRTHDERGQR